MTEDLPRRAGASVVVLAYGAEPLLEECVRSALADESTAEVVLVDNGCLNRAVIERLATEPRVRMVRPGRNLGFAGGCNEGARHAVGDVLVFLNSDAVVVDAAVSTLVPALGDDSVGIASAGIRLMSDPGLMNSAGNPLNYLGVIWAGGCGEPAERFAEQREVACASGACFAIRATTWRALDGFDEEYFAYHEDADLSVRCWQRGLRVVYVPDAVVLHDYDFSRTAAKYYLVERNRLLFLATLLERRTLLVIAPALVAFEVAMVCLALVQGWLGAKLRGYGWLLRHAGHVRERRRAIQDERRVGDGALARLWVGRIDPPNVALPPGAGLVSSAFDAYWRLARRLLDR